MCTYIYIYMYIYLYTKCVYIYIYMYTHTCALVMEKWGRHSWGRCKRNDDLSDWKKGMPWHFGENTHLMRVPTSISVKKAEIRGDPISADPVCPFPTRVFVSCRAQVVSDRTRLATAVAFLGPEP